MMEKFRICTTNTNLRPTLPRRREHVNRRLFAQRRANVDLNVLPELVEKAKESLDGEAGKPAPQQQRDLRLIDPQPLRRLRLSQARRLDQRGDLVSKLDLCERLVRIGPAQIRKQIAAPNIC